MRLTIIAGLLMGASLAVHSAIGAHIRAKAVHPPSAVHVHVKEIAPWYVAINDPSLRSLSSRQLPLPLYVRLQYQITLARSAGEGTASAPEVREGARG